MELLSCYLEIWPELNEFNVCKQLNVDMEVQKVNLIKEICNENSITLMHIFDILEMALVANIQFIEKFNLHNT